MTSRAQASQTVASIDLGTVSQLHTRRYLFAEDPVRHTINSGIDHVRVLKERGLYLNAIHVLAASNHLGAWLRQPSTDESLPRA